MYFKPVLGVFDASPRLMSAMPRARSLWPLHVRRKDSIVSKLCVSLLVNTANHFRTPFRCIINVDSYDGERHDGGREGGQEAPDALVTRACHTLILPSHLVNEVDLSSYCIPTPFLCPLARGLFSSRARPDRCPQIVGKPKSARFAS
jgi:hypothetical protein